MERVITELPRDPRIPTTRNALIMMVCNESANIIKTVSSISPLIRALYLLDTGSTDDTIELARNYCAENFIDFYCAVDPWIPITEHFLKRNKLLQFLYDSTAASGTTYDWIITADAVDEFRGIEYLRRAMSIYNKTDNDYFYINYNIVRKSDTEVVVPNDVVKTLSDAKMMESQLVENFHMAKVFRFSTKFIYEWRVHEQLVKLNPDGTRGGEKAIHVPLQHCLVYQNRIHDDQKSAQRYANDYEALLLDHRDVPQSSRPLLYLAQTSGNLGRYDECFYWYLCFLRRAYQTQLMHQLNDSGMKRWLELVTGSFSKGDWPYDPDKLSAQLNTMTLDNYGEFVQGLDVLKTMNFIGNRGVFTEIRIVCMRLVDILPRVAAQFNISPEAQLQFKKLFVTEAIHHEPFLAECLCHYAAYLHRAGQLKEAYAVMKMTIELDEPTVTRYHRGQFYSLIRWSMMASLALLIGRVDEAEQYLNYLDRNQLSSQVDRNNRQLLGIMRERQKNKSTAPEDNTPIVISCYL